MEAMANQHLASLMGLGQNSLVGVLDKFKNKLCVNTQCQIDCLVSFQLGDMSDVQHSVINGGLSSALGLDHLKEANSCMQHTQSPSNFHSLKFLIV